jgi:hypothetical protein
MGITPQSRWASKSLGEFLRRTSLSLVSPKSVCQLSSDSFHKRAGRGVFCKMLLTNLLHESYGYGEGVPFRLLKLRFVSNLSDASTIPQ